MITDWDTHPSSEGDAFVVAPDGSRAGLVWEIGGQTAVESISAPEPGRWGVWAVTFTVPMRTREDARRNLAAIVPLLRPYWERWRNPTGVE